MLQYTRTRTDTYDVCSTVTTGAHRFSLGGSDAQAAAATLAEQEPAAGPVAPAARAFRYRPSRASAITLLFRTIQECFSRVPFWMPFWMVFSPVVLLKQRPSNNRVAFLLLDFLSVLSS